MYLTYKFDTKMLPFKPLTFHLLSNFNSKKSGKKEFLEHAS